MTEWSELLWSSILSILFILSNLLVSDPPEIQSLCLCVPVVGHATP